MKYPPYPRYKDSGIDWIGDIPEHWGIRRLKNVVTKKITDGPHTTPEFILNGIPFLSVDGIQNGELTFENCRFVSEDDHTEFKNKAFPQHGDILLGKAASTGKIARVKVHFEFSIWSPLALIKINSKKSFSHFVEYALKSKQVQSQIDVLCTNNTQKNISMDDIPLLTFAYPPLSEQKAIADCLDTETFKIDELIGKQDRLILLLQEKRKALISHSVTKGLNPNAPRKDSGIAWLGEIPEQWEVMRNKVIFRETDERSLAGDEELLTVSHITGVTPRSEKEVNMFLAESLEGYKKCKRGDLIINTMWAFMGALGLTDYAGVVSPSYNVYQLRKQGKAHPKYLDHLYRTPNHIVEILRHSKGIWDSRLRLYPDAFLSMRIALPPYEEQKEIVEYIDRETAKIDALMKRAQRSIELLQEHRMALISSAVTGKIDVRQVATAGGI